jgi:5'-3' exonuclease
MTKLFVDLGYASFYRFYATKTWYKFSHPEEDINSIVWEDNEEFMTKFEKMFIESLDNVRKSLNINWENVILAKDCARNTIWRLEYYDQYKKTREAAQIKSGFNGHNVFRHISKNIIPKLVSEYKVKTIRSDNAEADDVVACLTKIFNIDQIYILANDTDYLQITSDRVHLIDFKCKERKCEDSKRELWFKILGGDTSDNIPSCIIDQKIIYPSRNSRFIKCSKKVINEIMNWDNWMEKVKMDNMIENNQQILNEKIISFDNIPINIYNDVLAKINS